MKAEVRTIAPADAVTLLASGPPNRKLIRRRVAVLADAMRNGEWEADGAPIRLDDEDRLLDGQHRLSALIEADMTLDFAVITGIREDARLAMDTGRPRSFDDHLTMHNVANARTLAATTRCLWNYQNGSFAYRGSFIARPTPTVPLLWKLYRDREDAITAGGVIGSMATKYVRMSPAVVGTAWVILSGVDFDDASEFFDSLNGKSGKVFDVIEMFRRRMNNAGQKDYGPALNQRNQIALMIKTWNFYRRGEVPGQLSWRPGGANPENFPVPI